MKKGELILRFSEKDDDLATNELGDFLILFRAAYTAALSEFGKSSIDEIIHQKTDLKRTFIKYLKSLKYQDINDLFTKDLKTHNLVTKKITKESPFEFIVYGVLPAIALAVIISGGSFKMAMFEAQLAPLGEGIEKLRKALAPKKLTDIGYSIKSRRIKLSQMEYRELQKYKVEDAHKGGFQSFFATLLYRVNHDTYELDLMRSEIDKIIKHAKERKRGGFQSSLYKIFNNHFTL